MLGAVSVTAPAALDVPGACAGTAGALTVVAGLTPSFGNVASPDYVNALVDTLLVLDNVTRVDPGS